MPIREQHNSGPPTGSGPSTVVVFSGGSAPDSRVVSVLPPQRYVIAADGGQRHASNLGIAVDLLVGDFDSLAPADLAAARQSDTEVVQHRTDKDATDLELALDLAVERSPNHVIVVGGGEGERLDHFVGMISLLGDPRYAGSRLSAWLGHSRIVVVRPDHPASLVRSGAPADDAMSTYVSLVPISDTVEGVTTCGLRFALTDATLLRHRTRGVSNEFVDSEAGTPATVNIASGALLVIQPSSLPFPTPSDFPSSKASS